MITAQSMDVKGISPPHERGQNSLAKGF